MRRLPLSPSSAYVGVGVASVLVAYGAVALTVAHGPGRLLTYPGASSALAAMTGVAGLALGAAGLAALAVTPLLRLGGVAVAGAVLWFAPAWIGWYHGPGLVRSAAALVAPFWLPTAVYLLLLCPYGRFVAAGERWLVWLGYAGTGVVVIIRALVRDPFLDVDCWADCQVSLFLVHPLPRLAAALGSFGNWFGAGLAVVATALTVRRLVRAAERGPFWCGAPAALALAAAGMGYAAAIARDPLEEPNAALFRGVYQTRCAAAALLGVAVLASVGFAVARQRALAQLAEAPGPDEVEAALRRANGDPSLTVAYRLPVSRRYVDAGGRAVAEPVAGPGRAVTPVMRGERLLAVICHRPGVGGLQRSLGSGLRLALENMLLRVEILAHLAEVQESRCRIVDAADRHRRTLERNLHDGAQQELAALLYRLRALARTTPDPGVDRAAHIVEAALDDLREIAHGIYPAVLDHAGLRAALATVADTADIPVEVDDTLPPRRYPTVVEHTAYVVVAEAVASAHGPSHVAVCASEEGEMLVITVPSSAATQHIADRVGAAGGRVVHVDGVLRVELPCGS